MGRSTCNKSAKRGNDSPHFNHSGDTQSAKGSLRATNMLTNIGNAPTQNLSPPVTDQPPLAPAKLLIILRTQNKYQRGLGRRSKSCTSSTKRIFSQKYVTFKTGKIGKDESLIINEEKVEAWFGKELKIVLDRVDKVKEGNSRRGIRPQSRFHCDTLCTDGSYPENAVTAPSISCDEDSLDGPIKTENQRICERDLSDLEHLLVNDLVPKAEIDNRDVEFIDQRILVPIVKLETDRDTEVETPNTVTGNYTNLPTNQGDITICDMSAEWKMSSMSSNEINQGSFHSLIKYESHLICDEDSAIVSGYKVPVTNNLVLKAEIDNRLLEFSDPPFSVPNVKLETARDTEFDTLITATGSLENLSADQGDTTPCDQREESKMSSVSINVINERCLSSPIKFMNNQKREDSVEKLSEIVRENKAEDQPCCIAESPAESILEDAINNVLNVSIQGKQYSCPLCNATFSVNNHLCKHLRTHTDVKLFECTLCNAIFSDSGSLTHHIETHETFECSYCKVTFFSQRHLSTHLMAHPVEKPSSFTEVDFSCNRCNITFSEHSDYDKHLRAHTDPIPLECSLSKAPFSDERSLSSNIKTHERFECSHCNAKFFTEDSLSSHIKTHISFECSHCNANFANKRSLSSHIKTHATFPCFHCEATFLDKRSLNSHIKTHKLFECSHCSAKFPTKGILSSHIKTHEKTVECFYCNAKFSNKRSLSFHIKMHEPFTCFSCKATFPSQINLTTHIKTHSLENHSLLIKAKFFSATGFNAAISENNQPSEHLKTHTNPRLLKCIPCNVSFCDRESLNSHIKTHKGKPFYCPLCIEKFSEEDDLKRHLSLTHLPKKNLECPHCNAKFPYPNKLKVHLRKHTGEKPYSCTLCIMNFIDRKTLNRHVLMIHSEKKFECEHCKKKFCFKADVRVHMLAHTSERPYKCTVCDAKFPSEYRLKNHLKSHSFKKPYACTQCDAKFNRNEHLRIHSRIHTGERPYECDYCKARFIFKAALISHIRIHTGEKPFKCTQCDSKFSAKLYLTEHVNRHNGYKRFECAHCNKKFYNKDLLLKHIRIHTGEKPIKCTHCKRKFTNKNNLKTHLRTHTGEKPHACTYCEKKFSARSNLVTHMRIHTGEKTYRCKHCDEKFRYKGSLETHNRTHTSE